jgi:hypothetical protein
MPIEPVDPSKKPGGDGSEKYTPNEKRGPGKFDEDLEKAKSDRAKAEASRMAEEHRAKVKAESPRTYTERLQDMGRLPSGGGGGGAGIPKVGPKKPMDMKKGGKVSEASHKKALEKAGFYDKGKTKSEREKIVGKVTTKPQRIGMVEKLFSAKKMNSGGVASKRADGCAIRGKTRA